MTAASTHVTLLLTLFALTTAAEELVPRLTRPAHPKAMPVLVEVSEAEAEARRQRWITRLRRASWLPPGKTFATLEAGRFPAPGRAAAAVLQGSAQPHRISGECPQAPQYGAEPPRGPNRPRG